MPQEYELTPDEHARLLTASRPVPYLVIGGIAPRSQYENVMDVWKAIAIARGFKWETVEPIAGKSNRFFVAEPQPREVKAANG